MTMAEYGVEGIWGYANVSNELLSYGCQTRPAVVAFSFDILALTADMWRSYKCGGYSSLFLACTPFSLCSENLAL